MRFNFVTTLLLIFCWEKIKTKMEKIVLAWTQFSVQHLCMQIAHLHTSSGLSSSVGAWDLHLCVRTQEKVFLLIVLPIIRWVTIYIHTLTNHSSFPIWDIPFLFLFFNSIGTLWATISHSSINYFGHINIQRKRIINFDLTKIINRSHLI